MSHTTDASSTSQATQRHKGRPWSLTIVATLAFAVGAIMHIVAVTFALLSNLGERLLFVLTPGGFVARELGLGQATWPGLINVSLSMIMNGLVYALVVLALVAIWRATRSSR